MAGLNSGSIWIWPEAKRLAGRLVMSSIITIAEFISVIKVLGGRTSKPWPCQKPGRSLISGDVSYSAVCDSGLGFAIEFAVSHPDDYLVAFQGYLRPQS
jgi:hypothetical protein